MDIGLVSDLLVNGTILLTASILYTFVYGIYRKRRTVAELYIGVIGGVVGVLVLLNNVHFEVGIIFDTRSILISTIGMFFGWAPTLIASGIVIATRVVIGGGGTFTGILVTAVSGAAGLLWREFRLKNDRLSKRFSIFEFYLTGVIVSALMLICMLTLPRESVVPVLMAISLPVLTVYPFFSLLICMVVWARLRQMQADDELSQSEIRFRALYEQSPMGVAFEDGHGHVRSNHMFERILGRPMHSFSPGEWPRAAVKGREPGPGDAISMEKEFTRPDGAQVWTHMTQAMLEMENEPTQGRMWLVQDITERKQREAEIAYLTYHDVLTGMYNRAFLEKEQSRIDTPAMLPLSVIVGDVNGLKLINDAFGHDEGDYLLTEAAKILQSSLRRDDIVVRTGGDEFLVLLPKTDAAEVRDICLGISKACEDHGPRPGGMPYQVSISLGHGTKESAETPLKDVIKTAEGFMYRRKLLAHKDLYSTILTSVKETLYEQSDETQAHGERMASLSKALADALGLPKEDLAALELAAVLHDIGKIRVDLGIIKKAGLLNSEEWDEIKKHPEAGYRIAQSVPHLNAISEVILYHHERWDGTGYPHGLKGEEIPMLSRILNLVDAYDTMREDRGYRKAMSAKEAAGEILRAAGKQFDPGLAHLFVEKILMGTEAGDNPGVAEALRPADA